MPSIHKRFEEDESGEEDFHDPQSQAIEDEEEASALGGDSEDDDEAPPEAVTASAALNASRSARQKVNESIRQAGDTERSKRQKLDASRVKQTRARRDAKATGAAEEGTAKQGSTNSSNLNKNGVEEMGPELDEYEDPPLLPLSVIEAAEAERHDPRRKQIAARLAEQQAASERREQHHQLERKRKFANADVLKPIKDVRVGSTRIRVLSKASGNLPPKSLAPKGDARDAWLARKKTGTEVGQRRAWKTGFLKR